jgi:serine/threonine-protein kinase
MADLGERLARALGDSYRIEWELGGGGMSRVFVATEEALSRRVVIKVLPDDIAATISTLRFRREIEVAASLHHPHIVPVLSAGEVDGVPFYIMPFVEGETLRARLARGPMPIGVTVRILREVASALQAAHHRGIIHRDIKPENILLAGDVASVTDFGVAKSLGDAADNRTHTALTSVGIALGTPMYMAPEQIAADPAMDERADIYALGCVAYEMLTGQPPFAGAPQALFAAHIASKPVAVRERRGDVPVALAELVMRCLEKSPADRPRNSGEVIAALDGIATGSLHRGQQGRRRAWLPYAVAAGVVLVVAILFGRGWLTGSRGNSSAIRSVGVIPFTNLSEARDNEYFSEGVTQEIAKALGKVTGLQVASDEAHPKGGAPMSRRDLSRVLGVESLLEGSVQKVNGRVRVTARLITPDGSQLWGDSYDRELKDVFAVQDEIVRAIVAGLKVTLTGAASRTLVRTETTDPEAHRLYLEGMYYWNRRSSPTLRRSMALFRQAIARDSNYASAWAGLSLSYAVIITYEAVNVQATSDTALTAGLRALALDSTSSDGMLGVAQARFQTGHRAQGLRDFERAVALDSNNARVRHWYAEALASAGKMDEALQQIHAAAALEPLSLTINTNVARVELEARHFREAEAALDRALELD